jgi:hypothetical protein
MSVKLKSLTVKKENKLKKCKNQNLRRIYGPKMKYQKIAENYITRSFIIYTLCQILLFVK